MKILSTLLLLTALTMGSYFCNAQTTIPNGGFDNWIIIDNGANVYDYPEDWEESMVNLLSRLSYGYGFFIKYSEPDANGNALLVRRQYANRNNGFIRFECDTVPSKLKGRYKFSGSDNPDETDTLIFAVHFSTLPDTLTLTELNLGDFPDTNTRLFTTTVPVPDFTDFEIDLSSISPTSGFDYVSIHIMINAEVYINSSVTTAVFDDLEFVYKDTTGTTTVASELPDDNDIRIYPNPASDFINIRSSFDIERVELYNLKGELLYSEKEAQSINMKGVPAGTYILKAISGTHKIYTQKIIKN